MTKTIKQKHKNSPKIIFQTFKEVVNDYKVGTKEAKENYLKKIKESGFKEDGLLNSLPNFILKKESNNAVKLLMDAISDKGIEIEKLTILKAKTRLKKGKKISTGGKSAKTILLPDGFSDRDYFNQLITLQHKYKECLYGNSKVKGSKVNKDILQTSLALVVIAIKAEYPRYQTENLYTRYKLSLESL